MFKIEPKPTFKAKVNIPVPGNAPVPVEFEFTHRTKEQMREFRESMSGLSDVDFVMQIACGWVDVDQAFNRESVDLLLDNFIGAATAISETYFTEINGVARKN